MIRIGSLVLALLGVACGSAPALVQHEPHEEAYFYVDGGAESLELHRARGAELGRVVTGGHFLESATFCPDADEFHCFSSRVFSFAVPRNFSTGRLEWSHGGFDYELIPLKQSMQILSSRIDGYYSIEQVDPSLGSYFTFTEFFYHPERGLLAIKRWHDDPKLEWPRLWLIGEIGFGAPETPSPTYPDFPVSRAIQRLPD